MNNKGRYEEGIFTIRFVGDRLMERGVSIYSLGVTLLAIQRIFNKGYLSIEGQLRKGAFLPKRRRELLSLSLGERKRSSDAFALIPVITDPELLNFLMNVADYVISGLSGYFIGDLIDKLKKESVPEKRNFISSIHADVVNIVNRIDSNSEIDSIQIGAPALGKPILGEFNTERKKYIRHLSNEIYLGPFRSINRRVYKLYPNSFIVTIRRPGGNKVNVYVKPFDFDEIRYRSSSESSIIFKGNPRYIMGVESNSITEFEANSIEIDD